MSTPILPKMPTQDHDSPIGLLRLVLIVGFFGLALLLYNLTVAIYDDYQIEQAITEFEENNTQLATENQEKLDLFQMYNSSEYTDKIAKQTLGLVNPGEQVVIIPDDEFVTLALTEEEISIATQIRAEWSQPKKWWKFFFSTNPFRA